MGFGAPRRERGGFGFPIAFTATVLSWAILEHGDQRKAVKQLDHAHDSLKWIVDYLINAHPSPHVLFVEVSASTTRFGVLVDIPGRSVSRKAGTLNMFTTGEFQFQLMQKPAAATSLSGFTLPIRT